MPAGQRGQEHLATEPNERFWWAGPNLAIQRIAPNMENHHGGVLVIDGCLYGSNGGNGGGYLVCLDFQTGDVLGTSATPTNAG